MKKILLASLLLVSFAVSAAEVEVVSADLRSVYNATVDTSFQMNETTGEGFVKVSVTEVTYDRVPGPTYCDQWGRCYPGQWREMPRYDVIYNEKVRVEGLGLDGEKVIYQGAEGPVQCGKMGYTRVFKKRAIFLSGKCELKGRISSLGQLSVKLITK